jgi:hypothetical protein
MQALVSATVDHEGVYCLDECTWLLCENLPKGSNSSHPSIG